jgi:SnoaL-like domain
MGTADLVTALHSAYNAHDPAAAAALYAADGRHRDVAMGAEHADPASISGGLAGFLAAVPDAHWAPGSVVVDGPLAAVCYELTGTLQSRLGPYEPLGQPVHLPGVLVVETDGRAIRSTVDYWDSGTLHRQLSAPAVRRA